MTGTERWSRQRVEEILARFDPEEARALALAWSEAERERRREKQADRTAPMSEAVRSILSEHGLPPLARMQQLYRRWEELAGRQWAAHSKPLVIRHGELVVEASDRRIVRRLRHDANRLMNRLNRHFGEGFVTRVRVVSPPRLSNRRA